VLKSKVNCYFAILFLKQAGRQGRSVIRSGFRVILILIHDKGNKFSRVYTNMLFKVEDNIYIYRKFRKAGVKFYVTYLKQSLRNSHGSNEDRYFLNVSLTVYHDISV